jgi:hypothetical protein
MLEFFKQFDFRNKTLKTIQQANEIIAEYQADGYDLTLRQLYYQFVARDLIPNSQKEYNNLGSVINNGRLAGLIDWDCIKDRTRDMQKNSHWESPSDILESCAACFAVDTRQDQDIYLEVWVEKEALANVIERIANELDIPWFACRGYVSQSAMYEAAKRLQKRKQRNAIILHLGDHDPSGVDMTRDIQDRLEMFDADCVVERIALNMDQVDEFDPPPNPAKITDSRSGGYIAEFGRQSWELDALDPHTLTTLIRERADKYTDRKKRNRWIRYQNEQRQLLGEAAHRWDDVSEMLEE